MVAARVRAAADRHNVAMTYRGMSLGLQQIVFYEKDRGLFGGLLRLHGTVRARAHGLSLPFLGGGPRL